MEKYCTLLVAADKALVPTQQEIMAELEQPDIQTKTNAIKKVLLALLNGERIEDSRNNKLLMSVIRYVACPGFRSRRNEEAIKLATLNPWESYYRRYASLSSKRSRITARRGARKAFPPCGPIYFSKQYPHAAASPPALCLPAAVPRFRLFGRPACVSGSPI